MEMARFFVEQRNVWGRNLKLNKIVLHFVCWFKEPNLRFQSGKVQHVTLLQ